MWDIAIWNTSRTSVEINNDLKGNLVGDELGLLAYYACNQGVANQNNSSETTLNDLSENNLSGSLENFSMTGGISNFVSGPYNNIFDASSSNTKNGTYKLKYSIDATCLDSLYIKVNPLKDATIDVTQDTLSFCILDEDTVLTVKQAGGKWIDKDGTDWTGVTQNGTDVTFDIKLLTNNGATNLDNVMFIYKQEIPCGDEDTIWIATTSKLDATINDIRPFCEDESPVYLFDSLKVKDYGAGEFFGIGISLPDTGMFNPASAYNSATGPYKIEYRIGGKCGDTGEVYIEVNPLPDPTITNIDKEFCKNHGEELLLSQENGGSWQWRHLDNQQKGVDTSDVSKPLFNTLVSDTGTFDLEYSLTTVKGCSDTDTVRFFVLPVDTPTIDSVGPVCKGSSVFNLKASPEGGVWTDLNDDNDITISSSGNVNPASNGTDSVVYTINTTTCPASDIFLIVVNDIPQTNFSVLKRSDCPPIEVEFTDNTSQVPDSSYWDFGNDSSSSVIGNVTNVYNDAGCYDVVLTNFYQNCSSQYSSQICSDPKPVADFTWLPEVLDVDNNLAVFENQSSQDVFSYEWDFSDLVLPSLSNPATTANPQTSIDENPAVVFNSSNGDTVNVKLKVTNANGCTDSIIKPVIIRDKFSVYLPNAFTPNDDDVNDKFFPKGRNIQFGTNYDFRIYNRWGTLIWRSKIPGEKWDGRVTELSPSGGKIAQVDVYVWRLFVVDPFTGQEHELVGTVTLMM